MIDITSKTNTFWDIIFSVRVTRMNTFIIVYSFIRIELSWEMSSLIKKQAQGYAIVKHVEVRRYEGYKNHITQTT